MLWSLFLSLWTIFRGGLSARRARHCAGAGEFPGLQVVRHGIAGAAAVVRHDTGAVLANVVTDAVFSTACRRGQQLRLGGIDGRLARATRTAGVGIADGHAQEENER